jgi:hypothetical protein
MAEYYREMKAEVRKKARARLLAKRKRHPIRLRAKIRLCQIKSRTPSHLASAHGWEEQNLLLIKKWNKRYCHGSGDLNQNFGAAGGNGRRDFRPVGGVRGQFPGPDDVHQAAGDKRQRAVC